MSRNWRFVGFFYLSGAVATAVAAAYLEHQGGRFEQLHTASDWLIFFAGLLVIAGAWPYFVGLFLLLHFGLISL
jgi:hypothetical protein